MMVKIFLCSVQRDLGNGMENCLAMRDSNGNTGINDLRTVVQSGSKVNWVLEKDSGIRSISRIWVTETLPGGKVFKKEPKKTLLTNIFQVDLVDSEIKLEDKYYIRYLLDNGKEVIIDPYIRIEPPIG